MNHSQF